MKNDVEDNAGLVPPSSITAELISKYSGVELLQMMIEGKLPAPPISKIMNFWLSEAQSGMAVFRGIATYDHYNPAGVVHGGWAATIMDSALGCAVQSALPKGIAYTTVELKVNLLRPIFASTGEVKCEGKIVHVGRTIATSEARLTQADGKLLAHGSTTCAVMNLPG